MTKLSRRNTIIVLMALVGVTGMLAASGAFTTVSADRTVNLDTSGDGSALLALSSAGSGGIVTTTGDTIELNQTDLNVNANTSFQPALNVQNNGNDDVGFYVEAANGVGPNSALDFTYGGSTIVGEANAIDIASGGQADIGVEINLVENDVTSIPSSVTLVADTSAYSGA